jgi:hypothetical protein
MTKLPFHSVRGGGKSAGTGVYVLFLAFLPTDGNTDVISNSLWWKYSIF